MLSSFENPAVLTVALFLLPLAQSQFIDSLPHCIRDCINQSQYSNCQITDITCLCRASAGNFLPDVITCLHGNCVNIDNNVLLAPLQFACELAGAPIPDFAVKNAESQASSLESQITKTATLGGSARVSTVTVTTREDGSTRTLVYPITIDKTTTVSGDPSTITATSTRSFTGLIPIVVVSTDDRGSTYTTTTSESGAISTYTTTNSDGSTVTEKSTYTKTASSDNTFSSSSSADSSAKSRSTSTRTDTTLTSTTVAGTEVTSTNSAGSSAKASQTSTALPASETNSAPFTDTNSAAVRRDVGNWLGLGILLFAACVWL